MLLPARRGRAHTGIFGVAGLILSLAGSAASQPEPRPPLHLATNLGGAYERAAAVGFNLADISSPAALDRLPAGMKGVLWLGNGFNTECRWHLDDAQVRKVVEAVRNHPKFSGIYYISDEPHPATCPEAPRRLAERSALIRSAHPGARTFIVVLNPPRDPTEFAALKDAADYIGVDPYPCTQRNAGTGCDLRGMRRRIGQALAAGIEPERIVPVFQTFGQSCITAPPSYYRLPSEAETRAMLAIWDELVPPARRPFDMAYSWGPQDRTACPSLAMADGRSHPDLLALFSAYFLQSARP